MISLPVQLFDEQLKWRKKMEDSKKLNAHFQTSNAIQKWFVWKKVAHKWRLQIGQINSFAKKLASKSKAFEWWLAMKMEAKKKIELNSKLKKKSAQGKYNWANVEVL